MNPVRDIKECLQRLNDPNVFMISVHDTSVILGLAYTTVHNAQYKTGQVMNGVEVVRVGKRVMVPTIALRKALGMTELVRS